MAPYTNDKIMWQNWKAGQIKTRQVFYPTRLAPQNQSMLYVDIWPVSIADVFSTGQAERVNNWFNG